MSNIKTSLKNAREAIKNKDYSNAIQYCKETLTQDDKNYLALVFLGLSLQELGDLEKSEKSFRKAIEIDQDNVLAWNGLANFFEKQESVDSKLELIKIYTFLIDKENNEKKILEYCNKLCNLYSYTNAEDICKTVYDKIENGNYSEDVLLNSRTSLANILSGTNNLSDEITEVYENVLSNLINNSESRTAENYLYYVELLYNQKRFEIMCDELKKMYNIYSNNKDVLTWICKLYKNLFDDNKENIMDEINTKEIFERLLNMDPQNYEGIIAKSIWFFLKNDFLTSKEYLKSATKIQPSALYAWILITKVNLNLHLYKDAIETIKHADKLVNTLKSENKIKSKVNYLLMESLSKSAESVYWTEAVSYYNELNEEDKLACLSHFTRANIKLGRHLEAKESIDLLKNTKSEPHLANILSAQLYRNQKQFSSALAILENLDIQSAESYLEIGKCYFDMGNFEKSRMPLLKAAKGDPNNQECFLWLGHYYRIKKDLNQARRCYEKAYSLCPGYSDAALQLSKVYRLLKNWDANYALLQTLQKETITLENSWVWLQLGLNYMEQKEYDKAINNLRLVLRVDSENSYCWESLADCYLSRGAFISAMKAYEQVLELSKGSLYPSLQIAMIKKDLSLFDEAITDFEKILAIDQKNILCSYGLAETYYKKALECFHNHRYGTARDCIQIAIDNLTVTIQQYSEISCLWKLFSDCCLFVTTLPDKLCCLLILKAIDQGKNVEGKQILEKEQLFQMATRCYSKALMISKNNVFIWHDLAYCYYMQAKASKDTTMVNELLSRAKSIIMHCIKTNSGYWQHWNLLGIIAMHQVPANYALAQHAFIVAVTIYNNSAMSWTNLGVIYLIKDDIKLANEAFAQAQRADPDYVESWIGQALLAELLDRVEAIDLFRHCTQLRHHQQAALGYGHWVCKTLVVSDLEIVQEYIENMHAIPVACDSLTWYIELNPYNSCAWNMLGILNERLGLLENALENYRKASNLSIGEYSDLASINYARVLTKLEKYKEAIKVCDNVSTSSFNLGIWYALALYKDKQLQAAFSIYMAIEQHLAQDKFSLGDVVACMAIIKYVLGEPDLAKKTIIKSFTQRLPTAQVMYALIALGVLQNDIPLVSFTLKQVEVLEDITESIEDFITLMSYVHLLQGNHTKAIQRVSKLVHSLPNQSTLWLSLCLTLLHCFKDIKLPMESIHAAQKCAVLALDLKEPTGTNKNLGKIYCALSSTSLLSDKRRMALIAAQKAVHCTPNAKECWTVLSEALENYPEKQKNYKMAKEVTCSEKFMHIQSTKVF